jgi:hypothetical protein
MKQVHKDQQEVQQQKNKIIEEIKLVDKINIRNSTKKPVKKVKKEVKKDTLWTRLKKVIGH